MYFGRTEGVDRAMKDNSFDITRVSSRYKKWGERYKKLTDGLKGFDGKKRKKGDPGNYQDDIAVRIYDNCRGYPGKTKGRSYNNRPSFLDQSFNIGAYKNLLKYFPNPVKCLPLWYPDQWYVNAKMTLKDIENSGLQVKPDKPKLGYGWTKGSRWNHKNKDGDLVVMRHEEYRSTLKYVTPFESFFNNTSPKADISTYPFWLLKKDRADFAYAILKYSMFEAWCNLMVFYSKRSDKHFSIGMWDTFPIQDIRKPLSQLENLSPEIKDLFPKTLTVEEAIKQAGQWRKNGWTHFVSSVSFDECMDELCSFGRIPQKYSREEILEKKFPVCILQIGLQK